MWTVLFRQLAFLLKDVEYDGEGLNIKAATNAQPQRFPELTSIDEFVHISQPRICLINSSEFLAW